MDCKDPSGKWVKSFYIEPIQYRTSAYNLWMGINRRCRAGKGNEVYLSTENKFEDFQSFAEWCQSQYGYLETDELGKRWQIDKDLFGEHYDPDTCVFLPAALNSLLKSVPEKVSNLPTGVTIDNSNDRKQIYKVRYFRYGKGCIGQARFYCPIEAHENWKENRFKSLLEASKDDNLSSRVRFQLFKLSMNV